MTHRNRRSGLRLALLLAVVATAGLANSPRTRAQAATPAAPQDMSVEGAAAAAGQVVAQPEIRPGIDRVPVAAAPATDNCSPDASLDSIAGQLNGTYEVDGKADTVTVLDFPTAPTAGGTLDQWLTALNDQLLVTLYVRLTGDQRTQYAALERSKCSSLYCQVAMRQKTIYYLLGGK